MSITITKTLYRAVVVSVFALTLALATGCGGGGGGGGSSPQALAKQSVDLLREVGDQMRQNVKEDDPKAIALKKKNEALQAKLDNLSAEDMKVYTEELGKLLKATTK